MPIKNVYYGVFNFGNFVLMEYVRAYTEEQAKLLFAKRIAKKRGMRVTQVVVWMKDNPDSFKINLEMEFMEDE